MVLERPQVEGVKMQTFGQQIGKKGLVFHDIEALTIIFENQQFADHLPPKTMVVRISSGAFSPSWDKQYPITYFGSSMLKHA